MNQGLRNFSCKLVAACTLAAFTCTLGAQAGQSSPNNDASPSVSKPGQVLIGSGDLLDIKVFDMPEMSQSVRVDDEGNISLNLIGSVHVADMSTVQAEGLIANSYASKNFLRNPQVSVFVRDSVTQGVSVLGEVAHPGFYSIVGKRTLFDVLSQAGGVTSLAGQDVSISHGSDPANSVTVAVGTGMTPASDVVLSAGDKIVVPRAGIVYVLGDVNRPGGYVMQNNGRLTLLEAVAVAMGTRSTAALGKARLIRKNGSAYSEVPVPLGKILKGKEPDQQLQAEDILYIPNHIGKSILYHGAPAAVQAASAATIYRTI